MAEESKEPESLPKQASAIAKRVQVKNIWLSHCELDRNVDEDEVPEAIELTTGVRVRYRFHESRDLGVDVSFLAAGGIESVPKEDKEDAIFRVVATFKLVYHIDGDEECDPQHIKAFARMNGIYNAWPYWREYLCSTLGRMGLPQIVVPVITQKGCEQMAKRQADDDPSEGAAEEKAALKVEGDSERESR